MTLWGPEGGFGTTPGEQGVTAEQLAELLWRMEFGFHDRAEVRDQIARRLLDEPDP